MSKFKERVLVLAPHTDDGELGCGGSITRLVEEGAKVYYAAFSICKTSLPSHLAPDTLEKEVKVATKLLGIDPQHLILFDFEVRRFNEFRQSILEELVKLRDKIRPDLVFIPTPADIHQDHQIIAEEGLRAFKGTSILGYELPWNNVTFDTECFIKLEKRHVDSKILALTAYESQRHRTYLNENFIRSLATIRGVQITSEFAEAFEVIRWVY
jgi:LmbE family N-acetylglucosaminyl deacetylase